VTHQGGEYAEIPSTVQELHAELRAVREQLTRMEQWVFMVEVDVNEMEQRIMRRVS
jgi:hypothetical protein